MLDIIWEQSILLIKLLIIYLVFIKEMNLATILDYVLR